MTTIGSLVTNMGPLINSVSHAVGQAARHANNTTAPPPPAGPTQSTADLQRRIAALEAQVAALVGVITSTPGGLTISSPGSVTINAGMITLNAPVVSTPGVIRTSTLIASSVVSASYTPGAGNVW